MHMQEQERWQNVSKITAPINIEVEKAEGHS